MNNIDKIIRHKQMVPLITGIESTMYPPENNGLSILDTSKHTIEYKDDLKKMKEMGINSFRAPVPWHTVQLNRDTFNWEWMDQYLNECLNLEIKPIVDISHHSSVPIWIDKGYANTNFSTYFNEFIIKFAQRYPYILNYTLINEPVATAALCTGPWYPNLQNGQFLMLKNMGKAICMASKSLLEINSNIQFLHTDPVEHIQGVDEESKLKAEEFNNIIRFLFLDLICGLIDENHPGFSLLTNENFTYEEILWFKDNPTKIDVLGLDYYLHNERAYGDLSLYSDPKARGIAPLVLDYFNRYKEVLPEMKYAIGEINIRGSIYARMSWLKYGLEQAEILKRIMKDKLAFICWYPLIDARDWGAPEGMPSLVTNPIGFLDPVGLIPTNNETNERVFPTLLSDIVNAYNNGEISPRHMVEYVYDEPQHNHPRRLDKYSRKEASQKPQCNES